MIDSALGVCACDWMHACGADSFYACCACVLDFAGAAAGREIDVGWLAYAKRIGSRGEGDGQFLSISGVDVDEEHVVACDSRAHSVSLFSKASGAFVRKFGSQGSGQGQFNHPYGVRLDGGNVYVCDFDNHRVHVWTKAGVFVRFLGSADESAAGYLKEPRDVVVDEEHVFVADSGNKCIKVFAKEGGAFVREVRRAAAD